MKKLHEAILDLRCTLTAHDKLLRRLWERICFSKGWERDDETNTAACQKFIDGLGRDPFLV